MCQNRAIFVHANTRSGNSLEFMGFGNVFRFKTFKVCKKKEQILIESDHLTGCGQAMLNSISGMSMSLRCHLIAATHIDTIDIIAIDFKIFFFISSANIYFELFVVNQ